ncbi:hypothetical protein EJ06DRAFT_530000 [Trichodelitschia bisporula]|uniref:Uncharacterized protein n=1 Tax=Trichodelitschia bisporula TaxID=703511 RepID=A0A6G1HXX8_9PEZI|nr:hypothetical protein EJ06DRAFT_530000 [Trichodelitschia bisporula]
MRPARILTSLVLVAPISALPVPAPSPQLGGIPSLSDLVGTLRGVGDLLQGQTLDNIASLIDNGAALLTPEFVNQTQTLIGTVDAALPALAGLLGSLGGTAGAGTATVGTVGTAV